MNMVRAVELMEQYSKCPACGNEHVGNGEGTLDIEDDTFKRSCKCGWKIELSS